jgi:hypothetical protein
MFSKEEAAGLREEFWTSFGKSFPRKWILYRTKIKGLSFKFDAGRKDLNVAIEINSNNSAKDELLFEQFMSLKSILTDQIPNILFDDNYILSSGKSVHWIYIPYANKFSIYNKNTWGEAFLFMRDKMSVLEEFFEDYKDFIEQANL